MSEREKAKYDIENKMLRYQLQSRLLFAIVLALIIGLLVMVLVVVPAVQWQADVAACVRILGLDEAYCADYLRVIRE